MSVTITDRRTVVTDADTAEGWKLSRKPPKKPKKNKMAVTITDRRTTQDAAESTTGWTGAGFGTVTDRAEGSFGVGAALNNANAAMYHTGTSRNLGTSPGTLVYVYAFNNALQPAWDNSPPPMALLLGDGTDRIAFDMAGSNKRVFNHLEGPTNWQCLVLDTAQASAMNSAGNTYVDAGSFAGLNFAAITQFGARYLTQSKALGGGYNVATDIIRFGNNGIRLTAGTTGDRGTFDEIAAADRSIASGAGHGILRAYTTIAFGVQGPLTFGDSGAATTCYFEDEGVVVVFEDRDIANDKYYLNVEGNSGATNLFILTGVTIASAGPHVGMDFSGGNIDTLTLDTCVFTALGNRAILFSSNADASGHTVQDSVFDGCGKITAGQIDFLRNLVTNSAATDNALVAGGGDLSGTQISGFEGTAGNAALLYNVNADPDGELDDMKFVKGTAATAAIEFGTSSPLSMTLRGCEFSGYNASNGQNDSALHIRRTSGTVTISIVDGIGALPSYRTDGATVVIQASASYTLTNLEDPSEVTILDRSISQESNTSTGTNLSFGNAATSEKAGQSFQVTTAGKADRVTVRLRKVGSPTDRVRVRLVNGVPGSTELLISDWVDGADLTTAYQDIEFQLQGKSQLNTSTTYGFEIERSGANDAVNYYQVEVQSATYASGAAYLEVSSTWTSQSTDLDFTIWEAPSENELYHVESVTTGTTTWNHDGSTRSIEVLVATLDFLQVKLIDSVDTNNKSVPILQFPDRVYSNP